MPCLIEGSVSTSAEGAKEKGTGPGLPTDRKGGLKKVQGNLKGRFRVKTLKNGTWKQRTLLVLQSNWKRWSIVFVKKKSSNFGPLEPDSRAPAGAEQPRGKVVEQPNGAGEQANGKNGRNKQRSD